MYYRAYTTYIDSTEWLYYVTYSSIYRYASATLHSRFVLNITTSCQRPDDASNVRPSQFCRWPNGGSYMQEIFQPDILSTPDINFAICFAWVVGIAIATIVIHAIPLPHFVKRKFRFK